MGKCLACEDGRSPEAIIMELLCCLVGPTPLALARGDDPSLSAVNKFGENTSIPNTGAFETIWDGSTLYVPPTQARIHNIASSLAADAGTLLESGTATAGSSKTKLFDTTATFITNSVAVGDLIIDDTGFEIGFVTVVDSETELTIGGSMRMPDDSVLGLGFVVTNAYRVVTSTTTGAAILWATGLSGVRAEIQEFVILNGTTDVPTLLSYDRQNRGRTFGTGSNNGANGDITSTAVTDATITMKILAGNDQTLQAVYTVPAGKVGRIVRWWASLTNLTAATESTVVLKLGDLLGYGYTKQRRLLTTTGNSDFDHHFTKAESISGSNGSKIPGGSDVWMNANADNAAGIAGGFDIILEDE